MLLNVRGLNSFRLKPRAQKRAKPDRAFTLRPTSENFLAPGDWATIYDVRPIYTARDWLQRRGDAFGSGGTDLLYRQDISKFPQRGFRTDGQRSLNMSASVPLPSAELRRCGRNAATLIDLSEADLDIEWAGGIAKNATVDYIYAVGAQTRPRGPSTRCNMRWRITQFQAPAQCCR